MFRVFWFGTMHVDWVQNKTHATSTTSRWITVYAALGKRQGIDKMSKWTMGKPVIDWWSFLNQSHAVLYWQVTLVSLPPFLSWGDSIAEGHSAPSTLMGRHEILIGLGLLIVQEGVLQVNHILHVCFTNVWEEIIEMGKLSDFGR